MRQQEQRLYKDNPNRDNTNTREQRLYKNNRNRDNMNRYKN